MRRAVKWLVVCLLCCVGLACWSADVSEALPAEGADSNPLVGGLAIAGVQPLDEGQQQAQEEALRSSPEAVHAREISRTAYENLSSGQAESIDRGALGSLIDEPASGLPPLRAGERITGYPTDNTASVDLGEGKHGVIESLEPLAIETAPGRRTPIDLGLREVDGMFEPAVADAGVRIPERVGEGVAISGLGVSLTPIDASGLPLGGDAGSIQGATVFYPNTGTDMDTVAKPLARGVSLDTVLRSIESPEDLFFKVGMPEGASLVEARDGSGAADIMFAGKAIALIRPPSAADAAGAAVPVSTSVSGDVLSVVVHHRAGSYEYPLAVDPEVVDTTLDWPGNWVFSANGRFSSTPFCADPECDEQGDSHSASISADSDPDYQAGQYGVLEYPTEGESHIYAFTAKVAVGTTTSVGKSLRGDLRIENRSNHLEGPEVSLPFPEGEIDRELCPANCSPEPVTSANKQNAAFVEVNAVENGKESASSTTSLLQAAVAVDQEKGPTASIDTTDAQLESVPNALAPGLWLSTKSPPTEAAYRIGARAFDPGIGVKTLHLSAPNAPGWGGAYDVCGTPTGDGVQCDECDGLAELCAGGQPVTEWFLLNGQETLANGHPLLEGEDTIESYVEDGVGLKSTVTTAKIKIDDAPPHGITLAGLPSNDEISDAQSQLKLKASATDGTGSTKSSGVASITLSIDGRQIGSPSGGCTPGPCTASGEWALNTEEYAAGKHTFTVVAIDNAGNLASESYTVTVHHASHVGIGPGSVNPASGDFSLSATDVSVSAPGAALTLSRSYASRHLSAGAEGPLGPQWSIGAGAIQSISKTTAGNLLLTGDGGLQTTFLSNGQGGYTPPSGDANLSLTEKTFEGAAELLLSNGGAVTTFRHVSGASASVWFPTISEGPDATNATTFAYQAAAGIVEPVEELAPVPTGVSCAPTLAKGCRALTFKYATSTTASGEARSQWGAYEGRLMEVILNAWEPKAGEMVKKAVAEYEYDKQGRLRVEWNPQITPTLKTIYGYDSEGHVTALTAPGQQPWLFAYGTTEGDPTPGRLIAVTRPSASTPFGDGELPKDTVLPTLSSTKPAVGVELSVSSNGTWSNSPLTFSYQWEDCNTSGGECAPIPGAVNQSYFPATSDEGHTLMARVSATNSIGTVAASTAASAVVAAGTPTSKVPAPPNVGSNGVWTIDYHVPISGSAAPYQMGSKEVESWAQHDDPVEATAFFPPDEPEGWPAENYRRATIHYLDSHDRQVNVASPGGGISTSEYNETNDVVRTLDPDNRQTALNAGSKSAEVSGLLDTESTYNSEGAELLSVLGPQHNVELEDGTQSQARDIAHYYYDEGAPKEGGPYRLLTKTTNAALVGGNEEELHTTVDSYSGQNDLGWRLGKPTSTTDEPEGVDLVHTTMYEADTGNVVETRPPGSSAEPHYSFEFSFGKKGTETGELSEPSGIAADANGDIYVGGGTSDDKVLKGIQEYSRSGKYLTEFANNPHEEGYAEYARNIVTDAEGDLWVASYENEILEFNAENKFVTKFGTPNSPIAIAVDTHGNVWVVERPFGSTSAVVEYKRETGAEGQPVYTRQKPIGSETEGSGAEEFKQPTGIAVNGEGDVYISDTGNDRIEEYSAAGTLVRTFATKKKNGKAKGEVKAPTDLVLDSAGNVWVADTGNDRIEEFSATGAYLRVLGKKGKKTGELMEPKGLSVDATGDVWVADTGNSRVSEWQLARSANEATNTQTIYYTAGTNYYTACGEHAEWAGLPCQTQPTAQPDDSLPKLQTSTYTYNLWDGTETATSTTGSSTRTTTTSYDSAGRPTKSSVTSTQGTALPAVTDAYNSETGALQEQSTTSEGKTEKLTSVLNSLGQLTSYTDADENTSTYGYDVDGRLEKANDGKGTQTYSYDPTTGQMTKLVDSAAGTFTASYDAEGKMTSEGYPNGMSANYTYDATGKAIGLEYLKTTDCSSNCKWLTDDVTPTPAGQWASQSSTLSAETYTYDEAGRLTEVEETPAGQGCTTRTYAYDTETNRTSQTTRPPASEGKCAEEGGTVEKHTYDEANRLDDTGTTYEPFGNITALPAADAGGSELKSSYYDDNQLASLTQNGETIGYNLDPAGRTRETVATGTTSSDVISHYSGPGDSPAWTVETPSGHWTRNISGINGALAAIQNSAGTTELQIADLHGDIVATASLSETETKLHPATETTEYGVPREGSTPRKYSWLGSDELPTELPSGIIAMGARTYIPQLGRFLEEDPVPGGSANAYAYTYGDPVSTADPSGAYTATAEGWAIDGSNRIAQEGVQVREAELAAIKAAEEQAAREEAERRAAEAEALNAYVTAKSEARIHQEFLEGQEALTFEPMGDESPAEMYGGGAEGGGAGFGRFANNEDPGLPPGAQCEGAADSKRYKKEHPKLCHEIESRPWEPLEAWCWLFPNPICNDIEKAQRVNH